MPRCLTVVGEVKGEKALVVEQCWEEDTEGRQAWGWTWVRGIGPA